MKSHRFIRTLALALAFNAAAAEGVMAQRVRPDPRPARFAEIAIEESTGRVLYERNASTQDHPASTTKLMPAYLLFRALENHTLKLDQVIPVSENAASQGKTNLDMMQEVTTKEMVVGRDGRKHAVYHKELKQVVTSMTVEQALRGMLCHSANDAAVVLAEALGGGNEETFIKMMNDEAKRLGMTHTVYVNPNGMPDPRQITTVEDQAKLARALIEDFPDYYKYFSIRSFSFNGATYQNTNHALLNAYPGLDGMKTGWIGMSGFNLVASAKHGDERVIAIVYGANTPDQRTEDMRHLLDFAFLKAKNPKAQFAYGPDTGPMTGKVKIERRLEIPPKVLPPPPPAPPPAPLTLVPANDTTTLTLPALPAAPLPAGEATPSRDTLPPAPKPPVK